MEKKRAYEQPLLEVEHSSFTTLVFSTTGGMGKLATYFFKRLASMIAEKTENGRYSQTLWAIRSRLNFALLRSCIMCIRGSRSTYRRPCTEMADVQLVEAQPL